MRFIPDVPKEICRAPIWSASNRSHGSNGCACLRMTAAPRCQISLPTLASGVVVNKYRDSNQAVTANCAPTTGRPGELLQRVVWGSPGDSVSFRVELPAWARPVYAPLSWIMDGLGMPPARRDDAGVYRGEPARQHNRALDTIISKRDYWKRLPGARRSRLRATAVQCLASHEPHALGDVVAWRGSWFRLSALEMSDSLTRPDTSRPGEGG